MFIYVSDLELVEDGIEVLVKEYGKEIIEERIGNEDEIIGDKRYVKFIFVY